MITQMERAGRNAGRMNFWQVAGFLSVFALVPPLISASDLYLARLGPSPLRFSPPPAKEFKWPVPLLPTKPETNSDDVASASLPVNNTAAQDSATNSISVNSTPLGPVPFNPDFLIEGSEANSLSASNLLNITPQMLADYFKTTLGNAYRSSTNGVNGVQIPFEPPTPKPAPSSEAIYRVQ